LPHTPHSLPVLFSIISHSRTAEPQLVLPLIIDLAHSPLIPTTTSHASNASLLRCANLPVRAWKIRKEVSWKRVQAIIWDDGERGVHHHTSALGPRF
jgi:hypothetical protein